MTKLDLLIIQRNYLTVVDLEFPFCKNLYKNIQLTHYFQDSLALQLIYFLLILFLIWKIRCYHWPIEARRFTM